MKFAVKKRDGAARVGELLIKTKKITTPNLAFISTSRFKSPDFADFLITNSNLSTEKPLLKIENGFFPINIQEKNEKFYTDNHLIYPKDVSLDLHKKSFNYCKSKKRSYCIIPPSLDIVDDLSFIQNSKIFIISNALQLSLQPSKFIDFITRVREKIGYQNIIYMPSIGTPSNFALFSYMGIDLFDSFSAIIFARNDILLFPNGNINKKDLFEIQCNCPSCIKLRKKPIEMNFLDILNHNYFSILYEIKTVRNSIYNGKLRELVETRVSNCPTFSAMLKILDLNHYNFLEERIPINRKNILTSTTKHSLDRVEIKRFQNRIQNRYIKPNSAEILLLLPCSSKKPYSFSKTHKLFKERISNLSNPYIIHEIIITSPIGIVPRELELIYPASRYDIAVSGIWDEDEKNMINTLLRNYLLTFKYKKIVVHVPLAIQDFILDLLKNPIITCIDTPTSEKSLDELSNILKEITNKYNKVEYTKRSYENILAIASYQFGGEIAEKLLEKCEIKGRYPYQKILKNNNQLGMITKDRGLISLTLEGAKILALFNKYWVEIFDDFDLIGSVFAPGIKDADKQIRIYDEIVILKNSKICGVGVAQMNGDEMIQSDHGEAVKVRHRC